MKNFMLFLTVLLTSCPAQQNSPIAPDCEAITAHVEQQNSPAPNCQRLIAAFERGRARVARVWPEALGIKVSDFYFYRPEIFFLPEKPYPLFRSGLPEGSPNEFIRGLTSPQIPTLIQYSYEEIVEHEATHAIMFHIHPELMRDPQVVAREPGTADPATPMLAVWQIMCHGTSDDPMMGTDGCSQPYQEVK
jgi:hypothetical protein